MDANKNIIIYNHEKLEILKRRIKKDGPKKLHIISDFDRTLTKAYVRGKETPSLISILRQGSFLSAEYSQKANDLYEKYQPIESDPHAPLPKKKKAMQSWWLAHFRLLIKTGLNFKDVERVINCGKIKLRRGALKFFDLLYQFEIPLVIMSASGIGQEAICLYLKKEKKLYPNVHIISNRFKWNSCGRMVGIILPIIHAMNKDETMIKNFPSFNAVKNRKNVVLLGDSIADIGMIKGFNYKNLIKIGFLNKDVKKNLKSYRKHFDVVIANDNDIIYVNKLIRNLVG